MNPSILSIGNATKDIFLEINEEEKVFRDERNLFHYDLTFDDSTLEYKRRAGIFGGVILSEKIFQAAHLKSFSNINPRGFSNFNFEEEKYPFLERYIISHKNESFILSNKPRHLEWVAPIFVPEVMYIADANFSKSYLSSLREYLLAHENIKLIFSLDDLDVELAREFFPRASLVFANLKNPVLMDLIDYSTAENAIDSFNKLGVKNVVLTDGEYIIAGNEQKISRIKTALK